MAENSYRVNIDPPEDNYDNGNGLYEQMETPQDIRRPSLGPRAYEPDIPQQMVQGFVQFYKNSIDQETLMAQLKNFDMRRPSVAPHSLEERRKSVAHCLTEEPLEEEDVEMTAIPQFNFRDFVTNMRKRDDDSYDADVRKKSERRSRIFKIGILGRELANIEGKYGAAVMSYFSFLQHIIFINVIVVFLSLFVIVPHHVLDSSHFNENDNSCSASYTSTIQKVIHESNDAWDYFPQVFTGKGILEDYIFYGLFKPDYSITSERSYDMAFTMTLVTAACFAASLLMILARASVYFSSFTSSKDLSTTRYTIQIIGSWNFGVTDKRSCLLQQSFVRNKLSSMLIKDSQRNTRLGQSLRKKAALYSTRLACHLFVIVFLGGCGYAIFEVQNFSDERSKISKDEYERLALSFFPSFTITVLYMVARPLFEALVRLESYSAEVSMLWNIARAALLRVASLLVMFSIFFSKVFDCGSNSGQANSSSIVCGNCRADGSQNEIQEYCWEVYIGQQMYKLVIMDFLMVLFSVFILETPRSAIYQTWKDKWSLINKVGLPEFNVPKLVLDASYTQTLCWISFLFCPFVPVMTFSITLAVFYLRKFSLKRNFKLSEKFSSTAEVRVYFLFLLCPFLILSLIIVQICMVHVRPSEGCGPYRQLARSQKHMFDAVTEALEKEDQPIKDIIYVVFDWKLLAAIIAILSMFIYYQWSASQGNDKLLSLLDDSKQMLIRDRRTIWREIHRKTEQIAEDERRETRTPRVSRIPRVVLGSVADVDQADDRSARSASAIFRAAGSAPRVAEVIGANQRQPPMAHTRALTSVSNYPDTGYSSAGGRRLHHETDTPLNVARQRLNSASQRLAEQNESLPGFYRQGSSRSTPVVSEYHSQDEVEAYSLRDRVPSEIPSYSRPDAAPQAPQSLTANAKPAWNSWW